MNIDKIRKQRMIKVLLTDLIMVLAVLVIVYILVAIVAGWRVSSDLTVEQNGRISIRSFPSGAKVIIDDEEQFQPTKMERMLTAGKHKVVLQKDGYDSWEKEVTITPGWLSKLDYPRLFRQDRKRETIESYENLELFNVSPDRTAAIAATDKTTTWQYLTDFNGTPKSTKIDFKGLFSNTDDGKFDYKIEKLIWSNDSSRVLVHATKDKTSEWALVDSKNAKNNINLTKNYNRFKTNASATLAAEAKTDPKNSNVVFSSINFEGNSNEKILAVVSGNLVRIDTSEKTVSQSLVKNVANFYHYENTILYQTIPDSSGKSRLNITQLGTNKILKLASIKKGESISYAMTFFNSEYYFVYMIDNTLYIQRSKNIPTDSLRSLTLITKESTGLKPTELFASFNKEFIIFKDKTSALVFNAELEDYTKYDLRTEKVRFLDDWLLYRVDPKTGNFYAWDFDNTNYRLLVVNDAIDDYDALISENNKYFYYVRKDEKGVVLVREKL